MNSLKQGMVNRCSPARSGRRAGIVLIAGTLVVILIAAILPAAAIAQDEPKPKTRAEAIELQRREKIARLWPESKSPIAEIANSFVERGLLDGVSTGLGGGNGPQFVLGGMRSGQGMSVGVGYRRSDLLHERLGFRSTVRGTVQGAWMTDLQIYFPPMYTERGFFDIYARYEYSPLMDYYGEGPQSSLDDRSSYRLEDFRLWVRGGWRFYDFLRIGGTAGGYDAKTGSGKRGGVPSIEDEFDPSTVPGLFVDGQFMHTGVFIQFDWRDNAGGPRFGGNYKLEWTQYWDLTSADQFNFRTLDALVDQYWPYANRTRVFALHLQGTYSFTADGQKVPFYLQPTLGGNDNLRGFQRYRFYADNRFYLNFEHRWHSFAGMDVALFVDAGKVANSARLLYTEDLRVNGGIGFRFKMAETVIMRIDQAYGNEGYRFMWTFGNIF